MSTEEMRDQALTEQANRGHKMIWITFRKEGLHKYPAALDDPKLATGDEYDVSFLGYVPVSYTHLTLPTMFEV